MTFSEEMQISCPPTVAFDLISDVRNETRWNGSVRSAELLTSEPVDRGSTFRTDHGRPLGQIEIESTIAVFDRPARLEYDATSAAMDHWGTSMRRGPDARPTTDDGTSEPMPFTFSAREHPSAQTMNPGASPSMTRRLPENAGQQARAR